MNNTEDIISHEDNHPEHIEAVYKFDIPKNQKPERIDHFLTRSVMNATRTKVQKAIENGQVKLNDTIPKANKKIKGGDHIECVIMRLPPIELKPQNISLDIIYEDDYLLVVNKPPQMCTHPGVGNRYGTLLNGVLFHFGIERTIEIEYDEEEESEGRIYASDEIRPGIVHRIDKNTSGLLVIAKSDYVHAKLAEQFANKTSKREYRAIVWGKLDEDSGYIEGNIARANNDRKKFAVHKNIGKYAKTYWEVVERYDIATLIKLKLYTGRTHQIRVHCAHINHPVFGDPTYNGDKMQYSGYNPIYKYAGNKGLAMVNRQMLHAKTLGFYHPVLNRDMEFDSELPNDMQSLIDFFRENSLEMEGQND